MNQSKSIVWVTLGAMSYGTLSVFVKLAYKEDYEVGDLTGTQAILGTIFLVLLLMVSRLRSRLPKLLFRQARTLFFWGIPASLTGIFYYSSMQYVPASLAVVLLFQFTWIGTLVDVVKSKGKPSIQQTVSLVLIFIGTILSSGFLEQNSIEFSWKGILLGLLSAFSYALFIFSSGAIAKEIYPLYKSLFMVMGSAMTVSVLFPPVYLFDGTFSCGLWKWSLPLALFGMVIPHLLYAKGMPQISFKLGSILGAIELPTAVFMASLVLQEEVSLLQWIGVYLILIATGISHTFKRNDT
ncbi:MAG: EamA family transporter [Flavobacteriales bacterium AspAUS03]